MKSDCVHGEPKHELQTDAGAGVVDVAHEREAAHEEAAHVGGTVGPSEAPVRVEEGLPNAVHEGPHCGLHPNIVRVGMIQDAMCLMQSVNTAFVTGALCQMRALQRTRNLNKHDYIRHE